MIFERKVSKQQSDDDKSFAVIKEGFDLKKKKKKMEGSYAEGVFK